MHKKLNNPVWFALCEGHRDFSMTLGNFKFYAPQYCPFGALGSQPGDTTELVKYVELTNNFYVAGEKPRDTNEAITFNKKLICDQMILEAPVDLVISEEIISLKNRTQKIYLSSSTWYNRAISRRTRRILEDITAFFKISSSLQ